MTQTTTDLRERAERLLAGIPEGEWEYDGTGIIFAGRAHVAYVSNHQSGERGRQAMRFIAAAPQLVRDLLAEIDRLRGQQAREKEDATRVDESRCANSPAGSTAPANEAVPVGYRMCVHGRTPLGSWCRQCNPHRR